MLPSRSVRMRLVRAWYASPAIRYEPATVGPSGQMPETSPSPGMLFGVHNSKSRAEGGVGAALPMSLPTKKEPPVMPSALPTVVVSSAGVFVALMELVFAVRRSSSLVDTLALNISTLSGEQ